MHPARFIAASLVLSFFTLFVLSGCETTKTPSHLLVKRGEPQL